MIASLSIIPSNILDEQVRTAAFLARFDEAKKSKPAHSVYSLAALEVGNIRDTRIYRGKELFLFNPFLNNTYDNTQVKKLLADPEIVCHIYTSIKFIPDALLPKLKNLFPEEFL